VGVGPLWLSRPPSPEDVTEIQLDYQSAAWRKLGRYLAETYPNGRILVVAPLETDPEERELCEELVEELKDGGANVEKITAEIPLAQAKAFAEQLGENVRADIRLPVDMWWTAETFDELIESHLPCRVIVPTFGVPGDFRAMKLWLRDDPPKLALPLGVPVRDLDRAVQEGHVAVAVTRKEGLLQDSGGSGGGLDTRFAARYRLVTPASGDAQGK